jgi:hypothetical protein
MAPRDQQRIHHIVHIVHIVHIIEIPQLVAVPNLDGPALDQRPHPHTEEGLAGVADAHAGADCISETQHTDIKIKDSCKE